MRLILASNSPRRRDLLTEEGVPFEVIPSSFEEISLGLPPRETALMFAEGKARDVYEKHEDCAVLGADTVVALDGKILGKPKDISEAKSMLSALSGRVHFVWTGVCLLAGGNCFKGAEGTLVEFQPLRDALIEEYVNVMRPLDKAGAYGIQDGYPLIKRIEGSFTNVVGLPMELVRDYLRKAEIC